MDGKGFQVWLSAARRLTRAHAARGARGAVGPERRRGIEGRDRAWCGRGPALSALRERRGGFARYGAGSAALRQCKDCGRTFNALSGTPLSGLHHKKRWLSFGASLAKGETVKASAARCDVAVSTAFRWRHRFWRRRGAIRRCSRGSLEADETYVLESRKGIARAGAQGTAAWGGKAKKRGLSREQVPVLMAADRSGTTVSAVLPRVDAAALTAALDPVVAKSRPAGLRWCASYPRCAAALGVSHEALNHSIGERVRGDLHVQTVNSRHSRLKDFLRPRRGIATRYLDNYLSWFHLVGLDPPAPMTGHILASPPLFNKVTHTIHELSQSKGLCALLIAGLPGDGLRSDPDPGHETGPSSLSDGGTGREIISCAPDARRSVIHGSVGGNGRAI